MEAKFLQDLKNMTLLYAEDEIGIRKNIADSLRYYTKEIFEASDGEEAFKIYKEKQPDIILTDIHMPNLDGISLVQKIRKEDTKIPIIMLTAHTDKDYLLEAVELKMEKYIVKPIDLDELFEALEKCIKVFALNKKVKLGVDEDYFYDYDKRELKYKDEVVKLNKKELVFLELLISNQNRIVTYIELEKNVWENSVMTDSALRSLVRNLRKKLPTDIVFNLSGVGYRLM